MLRQHNKVRICHVTKHTSNLRFALCSSGRNSSLRTCQYIRTSPTLSPSLITSIPNWLWDLLDDPAIKPKKALVVGDVDTTGMSKGEARAALKRGAKIARAAVRKQAMMEAKEKARLERMTDTQRAALAAETEAKAKSQG